MPAPDPVRLSEEFDNYLRLLTAWANAVEVDVSNLSGRVAALEGTGPPPPPPGGNIALWVPEGFTARVDLPQGHIGAHPDAETVTGPLRGDHTNKVVIVPPGMPGGHVLQEGDFRNITVRNPQRHAVNSYAKNAALGNCALLDVTGDAFKSGDGDVTTAVDCVVTMARTGLAGFGDGAKHYDGAQAHGDGHIGLRRVLIDWNDIGATNQTTGALFTQDAAGMIAQHVTVLDVGGTRSTCRFYGSGTHELGPLHFWGAVARNEKWNKDYPRELVAAQFEQGGTVVFNDVPGAADWLVDR